MRGRLGHVGLALLLLAGCGGSDGGDGSGDASGQTVSTGAERTDAPGDDVPSTPPGEGSSGSSAGGDGSSDSSAGGDVDVGDGGTAVDVCAMLAPDDVANVIGVDPGAGTASAVPPFASCDFDFPGGLVSASVISWPSDEDARGSMEFASASEYPDVEGIGDDAYDAAPAFGLTVRSGRFEISVNVLGEYESHEDLDLERQLAQTIIDQLP